MNYLEKYKLTYQTWKTRKAIDAARSQLYTFLELYENKIDTSLIRSVLYYLEEAL